MARRRSVERHERIRIAGTHIGTRFAPVDAVADRILIVEDEAVLCKHLARLFAREGYEVTTAASRAEARAELERASFEALLLDVMLPDGDGLDLLAEVGARGRLPQTVVMTAFATPENELRARGLNICHVLRKPLDLMELISAVRRAIPQSGCVIGFCNEAEKAARNCGDR